VRQSNQEQEYKRMEVRSEFDNSGSPPANDVDRSSKVGFA
jgi:hypothetical protein